jgi:drug/metabolite transporter (DMT)-like permease
MTGETQHNPLKSVLWMVVTGLCFVAMTAMVKYLGERNVPSAQSAFLRYFFGLIWLLPAGVQLTRARLGRRIWLLSAARGGFHTLAILLWFYALTVIPFAEVTAMNYLTPVCVTLGAALFLGEKLAFRRIAAICVALLGAMVILRPGIREVSAGHLSMIAAALCLGGSYVLGKFFADRISAGQVVALLSGWTTLGVLPFALAVWEPLGWFELAVLFAVAALATAGHYTMTIAFKLAPVAVTQPVTFLQLVWATLTGIIFFGEPMDIWVVSGGTLILGAVSFISWRETILKRQAVTPAVAETKL